VNARVGPYTVDFLWQDAGLVVEIDGYASHRGRQAFEDDRNRELYLAGVGLRLRRFSDTQVWSQPEAIAGSVLAELATSSRVPTGKRQPPS
jgi:very-short-patch-repair endonuclease